jgi:branched-subunit amino acid aminotransferase/4-amino-4-deoxychorismate lyase
VRVIVSRTERRVAGSVLSRCKSFAYGAAIQARREARAAGADDALLESSDGGLCCGTTANLLLCRGDRWLTPPLSRGCLPGVMRGRALALGLAEEAELSIEDLFDAEAAVLINSLGCRPLSSLEGTRLASCSGGQPEAFWRHLLEAGQGA